ncbi:MAG: GGDEF domain-containing protein [Gammaproteobacteria bacterium]|nr:GGDEF domain-containing protein [Gammaproteobacteria bacterium]
MPYSQPMDGLKELDGFTEKRLRIVLDAMPVAITWANLKDARILFMNRKMIETFGYTVNDFETVHDWIRTTYPNPEHRERSASALDQHFGADITAEIERAPVEIDVLCKDGTIKTAIQGSMILPKAGVALATYVDISARKRDEALIRHLAEIDPVTELPNRRAFDAFLARATEDSHYTSQTLHVLMLDLDRFKEVNDQFGHPVGDELLRHVARRLKVCVRSNDIVARFGGDEFSIILVNAKTLDNVTRIADKLIDAINAPYYIAGQELHIGTSIGIAEFSPDANDPSVLVKAADNALYAAKNGGRNCWRSFP